MKTPMIAFRVVGDPRPKGSTTAFRNRSTGRMVYKQASRADSRRAFDEWVQIVTLGARVATGGRDPYDGPVWLTTRFWMPRPQRTKFGAWPAGLPDLDKLVRTVGDCLVKGGALTDDSRIVQITATKLWADDEHEPGVRVELGPIEP